MAPFRTPCKRIELPISTQLNYPPKPPDVPQRSWRPPSHQNTRCVPPPNVGFFQSTAATRSNIRFIQPTSLPADARHDSYAPSISSGARGPPNTPPQTQKFHRPPPQPPPPIVPCSGYARTKSPKYSTPPPEASSSHHCSGSPICRYS